MEDQNIKTTNQEKEHDIRNIMLAIFGVFVILAAVSGATFAYYAFNASNNTTVSGSSATASLNLTITKISPSTTNPLVPQNESGLKTAATSLCVDGNNNNVCQVYKITIMNTSTATATVGGSIAFTIPSNSKYTNLKWKTISDNPSSNTNATYGTMTSATTSGTANSIGVATLAPQASQDFYIVIWINETGVAQNSTDYGTFTGTVTFTDSSGKGLTSTFTG